MRDRHLIQLRALRDAAGGDERHLDIAVSGKLHIAGRLDEPKHGYQQPSLLDRNRQFLEIAKRVG